jgi:FtsZ-interacting cell division protein ZipA
MLPSQRTNLTKVVSACFNCGVTACIKDLVKFCRDCCNTLLKHKDLLPLAHVHHGFVEEELQQSPVTPQKQPFFHLAQQQQPQSQLEQQQSLSQVVQQQQPLFQLEQLQQPPSQLKQQQPQSQLKQRQPPSQLEQQHQPLFQLVQQQQPSSQLLQGQQLRCNLSPDSENLFKCSPNTQNILLQKVILVMEG